MNVKGVLSIVLAALLSAAVAAPALAQAPQQQPPSSSGHGAGPGMMGPGMMGPGMMGPGMMGPGMMGPGMMGPGMMGQGGMGPGMMGHGMMGGMMGHGERGRRGGMGLSDDDLAFDERPLISLMLRQRQQLGLTAEQVAKLRELRSTFEKEAIRAQADLRILDIELDDLLDAEQVDLAKVEAAVRREEAARVNLRLSRIKTIEQGKALLTAEQRERLRRTVEAGSGAGPGPMGQGMMGPGMMAPGMGPGGRGGMMQPGTGGPGAPAQRP